MTLRVRYGLTAKQLGDVRHAATSGALRQKAIELGVQLPPGYVDTPAEDRASSHDSANAMAQQRSIEAGQEDLLPARLQLTGMRAALLYGASRYHGCGDGAALTTVASSPPDSKAPAGLAWAGCAPPVVRLGYAQVGR